MSSKFRVPMQDKYQHLDVERAAQAHWTAHDAYRVTEDGDKPKLLVTIEEKGPHARVDRLGEGASEPLFVMGNGALLSLNYLANKVVNRYPDDRIRLAVLPSSDEPLYLESLDEHQKRKRAEAEGGVAAEVEPALAPAARRQRSLKRRSSKRSKPWSSLLQRRRSWRRSLQPRSPPSSRRRRKRRHVARRKRPKRSSRRWSRRSLRPLRSSLRRLSRPRQRLRRSPR